MKKLLVFAGMFLGFASIAKADLLLEPYLGYEMTKVSGDVVGGGTYDTKPTGTALGLRLAYKIPMFWFGLDGSTASGKNNPDTGANSSYERTTIGLVAGVEFPILLRGWLGYGFSNKIKNKDDSTMDLSGTNVKLGVGFTGLPFLSINLEMITDTFDKLGGANIKDTFTSFKSSSYLLSVSLPLEL